MGCQTVFSSGKPAQEGRRAQGLVDIRRLHGQADREVRGDQHGPGHRLAANLPREELIYRLTTGQQRSRDCPAADIQLVDGAFPVRGFLVLVAAAVDAEYGSRSRFFHGMPLSPSWGHRRVNQNNRWGTSSTRGTATFQRRRSSDGMDALSGSFTNSGPRSSSGGAVVVVRMYWNGHLSGRPKCV